jgi:adenylate kinase
VKLLVLGPQGAGKGTQATRISVDYAIPHISTGQMFRDAIAEASELGVLVGPLLASGELVPDEITVALIRDRLDQEDARRGFILHGFPRNLVQAEELEAMLQAIGRRLDGVLFFDLPDEIAIERLLERAKLEGRADDRPEVIARRLRTYHEQTGPVVEFYRAAGVLLPLHAERTVGEVYAEVQAALAELEAAA